MSLIIELVKQYFSYVLIAVLAVSAGIAYFYAIYYAKKYLKQFSYIKYLHASALLIIINIFYLIVAIQRVNQGMVPVVRGLAFFLLSLSATIVYVVLAVAYTSNRNREKKQSKQKRIVNQTKQSPK